MKKKLLFIFVALITFAAIINLKFISFDNNIDVMLPAEQKIQKGLDFLQKGEFSGKVVIWLRLNSSRHDASDLIKASNRLKESLKSPLIEKVSNGIKKRNLLKQAFSLSKYTGQIIGPDKLPEINKKINPEYIDSRLKQIYRQALSPVSSFSLRLMQADPLSLNQEILLRLKKLSRNLGYNISLYKGNYISTDKKNTMLIIDTPVEVTDVKGSHELINYLHQELQSLPRFISGHIIAAHKHTLSNEKILKSDIRLTAIIVALAFLSLFILYFRDPKALIVFILPFAAIIVAVSLSSFIIDKLSYFIAGMGVVVAGIAIDYGIHVYVTARSGGEVKEVSRPITIGALTTASVFIAFLFSTTHGYRQLGLFSIISILLCLFYSLFLLPGFLGRGSKKGFKKIGIFKGPYKLTAFIWAGVIAVLFFTVQDFRFANDIKQFDGSRKQIFQTEKQFNRVWESKTEPAVLVAQACSLEKTRERNDRLYEQGKEKIGTGLVSFSSIWPSEKVRKNNYQQWKQFWKSGAEEKLRNIVNQQRKKYDFSENIFSPFFENLYFTEIKQGIPEQIGFLKQLQEKFLFENSNQYQLVSYFPDTSRNLELLEPVSEKVPGSFIVSRKALSSYISRAVSKEVGFLAVLAGVLIFALTFLLLRSFALAFLSLTAPATAVLAMLGIPGLMSKPFNAPAVIAAMVVVGLSIDYGIFMVYNICYKLKAQTPLAVTLSAVTTVIGSGALLFARHPVLFSIGQVLVIGVLTGYLTAFFVIPTLYRILLIRK